jgi:hypothetical protein
LEWTVGIDATVVRGHQHAAGARHAPPKDIPAKRLAPLLRDPPPAPEPFLDDAYRLGLLLATGTAYQFRYAEFHDYLVHTSNLQIAAS